MRVRVRVRVLLFFVPQKEKRREDIKSHMNVRIRVMKTVSDVQPNLAGKGGG